jgi:GTPase Era involved in 16S rRNA processing
METGQMVEQILKPLKQEVDELFEFALDRTANLYPLKPFRRLLQQSHQRLQEPMRVAIVGLIKAGKSTLMNALLGQEVVATGSVEATFNVNWLKYGEKSRLLVHFKNEQQPPEEKSFSQLAALTLRPEEHQDYLLSIKYIEVFHANEILKTLNIIDTPGLNSTYEDDSENTKQFLQMHGEQLTEITQKQASNADAVMYLFSHSLGQLDADLVEQLQGSLVGNTTPINAIGILTKVDFYASDPNVIDPLKTAQEVAQELREHPLVRRLFYTIQPVCGLLSLGAKTLTDEHWQTLIQLTQLPTERFLALNRNANKFIKPYSDVPISPTQREKLLQQLGQYGISLAYNYLQEGVSDREQLTEKLLKHTGLEELRHLILSHFGNRALLIKLGTSLQQIAAAYFQERQRLQGEALEILEEISGKFDAIRSKEHAFHELDVLRNYYDGKLDFDIQEREQLLQITGEYGISCGERLGMKQGERATIDEMIPVALERMQYWQARANDYMTGNGITIKAANVLARSYERIFYRVQKAKEYLYCN